MCGAHEQPARGRPSVKQADASVPRRAITCARVERASASVFVGAPGSATAPPCTFRASVLYSHLEGRRGRAPRQPGQVRKEAAVTGSCSGRLSAFHRAPARSSRVKKDRPAPWLPICSAHRFPRLAMKSRKKRACLSRQRPKARGCLATRRLHPRRWRSLRNSRATGCWRANIARPALMI